MEKNPLEKIKQQIVAATRNELGSASIPKAFGTDVIERPTEKTFGDLALPCFLFAKTLKKPPAQIAQELAEKMEGKLPSAISSVRAVGPYINFFLECRWLAREIMSQPKTKKKKKKHASVVIEYVSPNTNKPLHLGHVRNAVLGNSIALLLEEMGALVKRTSLVNDRGIHICKSMVAYQMQNQELRGNKHGGVITPQTAKIKGDHFVGDYYVLFEKMMQKDPKILDQVRACLAAWEAGDKKTRALWKRMNSWVFTGMKKTYKRLGITFDKVYYESDLYTHGKDIILKGLQKGFLKKDETGAVYADLSPYNLPNKILLRSDGTTLYITQDMYLAIKKWNDFHCNASVYVVASEQNLYLQQLFAVLRLLGYPWAQGLHHMSYGMVNLPEGKMKSREGTVVDADDLLDELEQLAHEEIQKRTPALSEKETTHRSRIIARAALVYHMISVNSAADITFRPKESIAFHGRTGPYILYTYARLKSILEKSGVKKTSTLRVPYGWTAEKDLLIYVARFEQTLHSAAEKFEPSVLAQYIYECAQAINDYYHTTPVLAAPPSERAARLWLMQELSAILKQGCALIGIPVLERM